MFDPTVGRWLQEDPIGFDANDPNLYRYVKNTPTNAPDPSGMRPEPPAQNPPVTIDVPNIFTSEGQGQDQALVLSVEITNNELVIRVQQGRHLRLAVDTIQYPFQAIIAGRFVGSNKDYKDTDSLQY